MPGRFPILYIAEAGAQDAALSCGVLAWLVEAMPQAGFTVVGSPASAPLFADTPRLDRLIVLERESRLDWVGLWNQVRSTSWGLVVDMRGSTLSGKLKRQKRAVRGKGEAGVHAVELAARVLQLDEIPPPRLFVSEDTRASVEALIPAGDGPILAVGPGAAWMGRRWPAERYAKVASALVGDGGPLAGGRVLVVGDDSDRDAAHTLRLALPRHRTIELHGRLTPVQVVAAVQRSQLYLGGDSLWTDLAVTSGTPVVAAYGPSDEVERGPWGGVAVRGPRSVDEYRKIDPRLDQAIEHMNDLPADRVLKAARKALAEQV
ncbi:glycosyltransferase family 9 protein [Brevundimonas basaltis]|uniref:ADP-heptose:LPS heptosyltransferase n=1 Tax=Brevundimonas basaltis TaxID=472166 RepID=A0A7W8MH38_9CAUL|nr:glycosyltransferase family 9 protein [Brevundimonas basaltis]MBB5292873.1 ADP-heptose:LPS heptosyltransferase [Brevundimonas basaltis]